MMARAGALVGAMAAAGCTHAGGRLMVDSPKMLPYQAPDADEIAGVDTDEAEEGAGAGSGSAQPAHK
jgi:hypothetical protein